MADRVLLLLCRSAAPRSVLVGRGRRRMLGLVYEPEEGSCPSYNSIVQAGAGRRLRGLIVILWRAGLRVQEALALTEADLDQRRGLLLVRRGKGGRRREVGIDDWGWQELEPWLERRLELPVGPLFCVINGATSGAPGQRGRPCATPPDRGRGRRTPALRATPTPPRARC